jgi:hypothetical protein
MVRITRQSVDVMTEDGLVDAQLRIGGNTSVIACRAKRAQIAWIQTTVGCHGNRHDVIDARSANAADIGSTTGAPVTIPFNDLTAELAPSAFVVESCHSKHHYQVFGLNSQVPGIAMLI